MSIQSHSLLARILIISDSPASAAMLEGELGKLEFPLDVSTAYSTSEALVMIKDHALLPDLLLLDIEEPHKGGFEILQRLQVDPLFCHIPVIVVTSSRISSKDVQAGLTLGAEDYVTSPVDGRELSARIRAKLRVKQAEDALRLQDQKPSELSRLVKDQDKQSNEENLAFNVLANSVAALGANNGHLLIFHSDGFVTHHLYKPFDFSPWSKGDLKNSLQNTGVIVSAITSRKGGIVEDTTAQKEWVPIPNDPTQSAIAVPLLGRREVLGVLTLTQDRKRYFKHEHIHLLQAIANQAAFAIESALLYAVEHKRVNELVALHQLIHHISQFTKSTALFENLAKLVRQHLNYPAVTAWLVEDGINISLCDIAGEGNAPRFSLLEIAPKEAAATNRSASFSGSIDERIGERFGFGRPPIFSSLAVPLRWNNQLGGVLAIHSQQTSTFQESDRILLETIGAQVGIVLERIDLFESIEQARNRTAAVLRTAADAILVLDEQGRFQMLNPAAEKLFPDIQISPGTPLQAIAGYSELTDLITRARETGQMEQADLAWVGGQTLSAVVSSIEHAGHVIVLHDVSHFMAINQLQNEFIATASHDLKNPIFAVLGYSDLLERVGSLNETQREFLTHIRHSARLMQDLVINMLDIARIEMGIDLQRDPVNLTDLIERTIEELRSQATSKDLVVNKHLPDAAPIFVLGDATRLHQAFRNIVDNALKYTPSGGQVDIETRTFSDKVLITVRDNGIGIPPDALPHIFEKFYRVHTDATVDIEGNGLGLAIVKSIIEQHGGEVTVESTEGKGSSFHLYLKLR